MLRLAFASAPPRPALPCRTEQLADSLCKRHAVTPRAYAHMVLPLLVSKRFQVLFTLLCGVLFTFPSRYWFTIGHQGVFSLGGRSLRIPAGFHVSRGTQEPLKAGLHFHLWGCHPLWPAFPDRSANAPLPFFNLVTARPVPAGRPRDFVALRPRTLLADRPV